MTTPQLYPLSASELTFPSDFGLLQDTVPQNGVSSEISTFLTNKRKWISTFKVTEKFSTLKFSQLLRFRKNTTHCELKLSR